MKRSEAIKIIEKFTSCECDVDNQSARLGAELLLKELEAAGMLPPVDEYTKFTIENNLAASLDSVFVWDQE